jgi:hypothetical protein
MSPALSALDIFQIGSPYYAQAGLDHVVPNYASCVAGMIHACPHTQFFKSLKMFVKVSNKY